MSRMSHEKQNPDSQKLQKTRLWTQKQQRSMKFDGLQNSWDGKVKHEDENPIENREKKEGWWKKEVKEKGKGGMNEYEWKFWCCGCVFIFRCCQCLRERKSGSMENKMFF